MPNFRLVPNRHILVTHLMCNRQVIEGSDAVNPTFLTPDLLPLPFLIQGSSLGRIGIVHSVMGATLPSAHGPCGRDRQHVDRVDGKKLADLISGN